MFGVFQLVGRPDTVVPPEVLGDSGVLEDEPTQVTEPNGLLLRCI